MVADVQMRIVDYDTKVCGRAKIYTDQKVIDRTNIIDVLIDTYKDHLSIAEEIAFLFAYEKGNQPLKREKLIRKDIDIKAQLNIANDIKEFKLDYGWSSPIMLIQRGDKECHDSDGEQDDNGINALNEMLRNAENIGYKDLCMAESIEICGIGHRLIDIRTDFENTESLVHVYNVDSQNAYCVYYAGIGEEKVLGVTYISFKSKYGFKSKKIFTCFTKESRFTVIFKGESITKENAEIKEEVNPLVMIPLIEYERAFDRTGCFERVIPQLDAVNILNSDFVNLQSQIVQGVWWGNDIEFPKDKDGNPIKPQSGQWILTYTGGDKNPKIQPLDNGFDGTPMLSSVEQFRERIYQSCGYPNQKNATGATGTATEMSSGWTLAELKASREERIIEFHKREELALILKALEFVPYDVLPKDGALRKIHVSDIDFHFNRRKDYDMATKASVFATYIKNGVHGRHALKYINAFPDTEQVWVDSRDNIEKLQKQLFEPEENASVDGSDISNKLDQIQQSPFMNGLSGNSDKSKKDKQEGDA